MGKSSRRKRQHRPNRQLVDVIASTAEVRRRHGAGLLRCGICKRSISPNERSASVEILGELFVACHEHVPALQAFVAEVMAEAESRGYGPGLVSLDGPL